MVEKEKAPAALEMLEALQDFGFSGKDQRILSSAMLLGKQILQDAVASQPAGLDFDNQSSEESPTMDKTKMVEVDSPIVKKAEDVLSQSSEILKGIL